jgi:hypothetical protein
MLWPLSWCSSRILGFYRRTYCTQWCPDPAGRYWGQHQGEALLVTASTGVCTIHAVPQTTRWNFPRCLRGGTSVTIPVRSHNRPAQRREKVAPADVRPMRPPVLTSQLPAPPIPVPPFEPDVCGHRTVCSACSTRRQVPASAAKTAEAARSPIVRPGPGARLVAAAAITLIVVSGLGWIGQNTAPAVPANTAVVQVGAGETLWDIARRAAPRSDPRAVVERIRQLNRITGSAVSPGQWLRVPDSR